jgi:hypothetical protein
MGNNRRKIVILLYWNIFIIIQQNQGHMPNIKTGKNGRFISHAKRIEKICENCGNIFLIKESSIKYGRGRCCSRKCVDENKKKNVGDKNPVFGKKQSEEQKKQTSARTKQMWNNPSFRKHIDDKRKEYKDKTGYAVGASPESIARRKKTMLEKYGAEHNWMVKKIRQKCEDTCMKLYGKRSWEFAYEAMENKETLIEVIIRKILEEEKIKFESYYKVYTEDGKYKEYDFYLTDKNILIEADGDYWHANPKIFSKDTLNETQIKNITNDEYKNNLANDKKITLLRFWESDIIKPNFRQRLIQEIQKI